ncbi:hypothetical protein NAP1_14458 [Erythrobacter sp. NAP1]|uniref:hypothetical protein n=1 Tax=Erythrobacter sp. NAP1 TaxID=237727 RepID=UPI00006876E1|nr:hypothetical protein [Erythrobacter sp. NAP1]EAQ28809.1 hypothetical protein NAP1_14458 [Erythrobacter sp. NAP1]
MQVLSQLFEQISEAVRGEPTLHELRALRDSCDAQTTRRATFESFRGINNPNDADSIIDLHKKLIRDLEEKISSTREKRDQAKTVGMGIGGSVAGGGIVAALALAVPAVALIPIAGGAYCVWRGSENAKTLTSELTLYIQLKDAVEQLLPKDD